MSDFNKYIETELDKIASRWNKEFPNIRKNINAALKAENEKRRLSQVHKVAYRMYQSGDGSAYLRRFAKDSGMKSSIKRASKEEREEKTTIKSKIQIEKGDN